MGEVVYKMLVYAIIGVGLFGFWAFFATDGIGRMGY